MTETTHDFEMLHKARKEEIKEIYEIKSSGQREPSVFIYLRFKHDQKPTVIKMDYRRLCKMVENLTMILNERADER